MKNKTDLEYVAAVVPAALDNCGSLSPIVTKDITQRLYAHNTELEADNKKLKADLEDVRHDFEEAEKYCNLHHVYVGNEEIF
jgi:hypothetical protein